MVPSAFVFLEALPLTPNGKLDRRSLPAPDRHLERDGQYVPPRNPVEEQLCAIWQEVLRLDRVGVHDNFFELGGHSLLATQVVSRIRSTFAVELPLRVLFEFPTVAELALRVEGAPSAELPPIVPTSRQDELPLSFAQQRLWFLDQMGSGVAYNMPLSLRLKGNLNREALRRAIEEIVRRHEALRTTFTSRDGQPHQVIHDVPRWELPLRQLDETLTQAEREEAIAQLATKELLRPFELSRDIPLRTQLIQLASHDHLLLATLHHIASDGWSLGVLVRELRALYVAFVSGQQSPLRALTVQYADFATWQRHCLRAEVLEKELYYWRQQLEGCSELALPTDRPRPEIQTHAGDVVFHRIQWELCRVLKRLNKREGLTLYMTLLTVFQVLLSRYTRQTDIVVGLPIANRNRLEIESLIGFFVNSLAIRLRFPDNPTFRELLHRVRKTTLEAYAHQDMPFEKLVEEIIPGRALGHTPLFNVTFAVQNAPMEDMELPGLKITPQDSLISTTRFDLEWHVWEVEDELSLVVCYRPDLFDRSTIERMIQSFVFLLEHALGDIDSKAQSIISAVIEFEARQYRAWLDQRQIQNAARLKQLKRRAGRVSEDLPSRSSTRDGKRASHPTIDEGT
jgi:acyl carrier protein/NRPS condensation-like uncharacterized protein